VVRKSARGKDLPVDWEKAKALAQSTYGFPLPITENSPDLEEVLAAVHIHPAPPREKAAPHEVSDEGSSSPQTEDGWYVQTGSFKVKKNAQQLAIMLKRLGPPIPAEPIKTGGYHRVLAGPFPSKAEAEANAQRIESSFGTGALVLEPRGI
jgi:cell division septation protein DedD